MIDARTMQPWDSVYTFVDNAGQNVNIASGRLTKHVASASYEIVLIPVEVRIAQKFCNDNCVAALWIEQMLASCKSLDDLPPIIFAECLDADMSCPVDKTKVSHMLVDGHHRYVLHAVVRAKWIRAIILTPEQWQPLT